MKKVSGCLILVLLVSFGHAQMKYIVQFKNKANNPYSLNNPSAFLTQKAINRRAKHTIAFDSTDLPVTPVYVDSIRLSGAVIVLNASKWLNSVSIQTTDAAALTKIRSFPFVQSVTGIAARMMNATAQNPKFNEERIWQTETTLKATSITADVFNYGSSYAQIHIHNGEFLHDIGLRGQNMIVGMLDAGFNNYLTVKAFDSARNNNQILGVYDFVARDSSVNEDNAHGMETFSVIAANIPSQFVGTAPKANFYLFRTEDANSEYPIEEHNWVCGAERIDSLGGDVISSSIGYTTFDPPLAALSHTYGDMNGNTTMAAIGAGLAAKKGMLVVNAAGNEGSGSWKYIVTPADGDSVLAVGAVNASGAVANFSSYGPSSDGQVKPDVASVGVATTIESPSDFVTTSNGTSFAAPNIAGLATCLWQGFPEFNNIKIINALRQSGNKSSAPDDRIGYGIPDVKKAVMNLLKEFATSSANVSNCQTTLVWASKDVSSMKYEIERMLPGQTSFKKIAEQNGSGSVFGIRSAYQYQDMLTGISPGTISYRIRQVIDTNATGFTADYIGTVNINLQTACVDNNAVDVTLLPNPAKVFFTVKLTTPTASSSIVIQIFNSAGQLIQSLNKSKLAGTVYFDGISLLPLAKDKYYVSVYDGTKRIATKELIKL